MENRQILSEADWLQQLLHQEVPLHIEFRSVPFRMKTFPGWDTGEQKLTEHLLYFIAENRAVAILEGKRHTAIAGHLIWVTPQTSCRFHHISGEPAPLIYRFRFKLGNNPEWSLPWPYQYLPKTWQVLELLKQVAEEATHPSQHTSIKLKNLFSLLSIEVFRFKELSEKKENHLPAAACMKLQEYVAENLNQSIQPSELARLLDLTPDYFSRVFRKTFGEAPRSWLLKQKLYRASVLLQESTASISEIAEQLGYQQLYLFSRQFQHQFGMGPRRWRQKE